MNVLPIDDARTLAFDLLRKLSEHIGDPDAIEAELQWWVSHLGCARLSQVLLAAVEATFAECLSIPDQFPPDGIRFDATKENQ